MYYKCYSNPNHFCFFLTNATPSEDRRANCFSALDCSVLLVIWSSFWLSNEQANATYQNRTERSLQRRKERLRLRSLEFSIPAEVVLSPPVITQKVTNLPRPSLHFLRFQPGCEVICFRFLLFVHGFSVSTIRPKPHYLISINMSIFFGTDGVEQKIDFYLRFVCFSFWSLQSWPTTATCASQWITARVSSE